MRAALLVGLLLASPAGAVDAVPTSSELRRLFDADQADRDSPPTTAEGRAQLVVRDRERRESARRVLAASPELGAEDLERAATIFQHGESPDDFLVARELAVVAGSRGVYTSLPALAEDRWLLAAGRPQRFGSEAGALDRLDRDAATCVTDALRRDFLVAPLEAPALADTLDATIERLKQHADPAFRREAATWPESRELAALADAPAAGPLATDVRERVLALYRDDRLALPEDLARAAALLARGSTPEELILANELAALAALRRAPGALELFAATWDRFSTALGVASRYGTLPASHVAPSVPPAVRRALTRNG